MVLIKKIITSLNKKKLNNIIVNVGSGKSIAINNIIYICNKKFNFNINPTFVKIDNKEIMITKANIKKVNKIFKWKPKVSLLNSLKSYKKYLR